MKRLHFETFQPICPTCRTAQTSGRVDRLLEMAHVYEEIDDDVLSGLLLCPDPDCRREYPIIDGIPILLVDLRGYVGSNLTWIRDRGYGSAGFGPLESLIGDCCGPGSPLDATKQQLSSYGWSHWGDFVQRAELDRTAGSIARLLEEVLECSDGPAAGDGPALDLGCGAGRTTFELAGRSKRPVLGIDMNWPLLRMARQALGGKIQVPVRRVGMVYDDLDIEHTLNAAQVDFWACDAANLPFSDAAVAQALGLNLLDSTTDPVTVVNEIARVLRDDGRTSLACPFDWSPSATPVEAWIGGHSQRGDHLGASEPVLRSILATSKRLRIVDEADDLPWPLRLHERATMDYRVHLIVARALVR